MRRRGQASVTVDHAELVGFSSEGCGQLLVVYIQMLRHVR